MPDLGQVVAKVKTMSYEERQAFEDKLLVEMPDLTSNVENDTFYGCLGSDSSSLDACLPSCLNGYRFLDTPTCNKRVYSRSGSGQLELQNNMKTDRAYVYLNTKEQSLTSDERRMLCMKHKIREVYVYRKNDVSRYEHIETLNLRPKKSNKDAKSATSSIVYVLAVLFFIFIVFLVSCLIYSLCYGGNKTVACQEQVSPLHT